MLYSPIHLHPVFSSPKRNLSAKRSDPFTHEPLYVHFKHVWRMPVFWAFSWARKVPLCGTVELLGEASYDASLRSSSHPILRPLLLCSPLQQLLSPVHRSAPAHILRTDTHKCLCRPSWNADRYNSRTDRIPEYPPR